MTFNTKISRLRLGFWSALETETLRKALRNAGSRARYGLRAPLSDECLWADPNKIILAFRPKQVTNPIHSFTRLDTGRVVAGDWDRTATPLSKNFKHKACLAHFRDGVAWEETGIFDFLLDRIEKHGGIDGLRSLSDIKQRYAKLDVMAKDAESLGRLRARRELGDPIFWREREGVMVHIARDGGLLRQGNGIHRLALSQALNLPIMPVRLGDVLPEALGQNMLRGLRKRPTDYPVP